MSKYVSFMFYYWFVVRFLVFCCKQKTAYEMRISDWSSDVCSSDLSCTSARGNRSAAAPPPRHTPDRTTRPSFAGGNASPTPWDGDKRCARRARDRSSIRGRTSEEHTSELQSLMRISYAVFCFKHKKTDTASYYTFRS